MDNNKFLGESGLNQLITNVHDVTFKEISYDNYMALPEEERNIGRYAVIDWPDEINETGKYSGSSPIGTVIAYMGIKAPNNYLICDGTEYEISKYKDLADFFNSEFGSVNYFGGDGYTTFAVPDLRGEFLRGSGENSHTEQGSGANVGEHQDATNHQWWYTRTNTGQSNGIGMYADNGTDGRNFPTNCDALSSHISDNWLFKDCDIGSPGDIMSFTSRPTNTSVLYCIKYTKPAGGSSLHTYSTEEQLVGTWIDGKPVYECVVDLGYDVRISSSADSIFPNQDILHELNCEQFLDGFMIINDTKYTGYRNPIEMGKIDDDYAYKAMEDWTAKPDRHVACYIKYTKTTD